LFFIDISTNILVSLILVPLIKRYYKHRHHHHRNATMKSSIILASTLTLIAPILAAPTGETSGTLVARDNAKLNQYNHPDW
jgi:cytochrome bd-type quinol oxidase subunit 1